MSDLVGTILAGGKSSRFGSNKAFALINNERLIDRSVRLLSKWCSPVVVVANRLEEYIGIEAVLVSDIIPERGPLVGVYTALLFSPKRWVFIRAVDMPFLTESFVALLREEISEKFDVIVPLKDGQFEPLCALYSTTSIPHIERALERGGERIIHFYKKARVKIIPEEKWRQIDPEGINFLNVNTQEELQRITCGLL